MRVQNVPAKTVEAVLELKGKSTASASSGRTRSKPPGWHRPWQKRSCQRFPTLVSHPCLLSIRAGRSGGAPTQPVEQGRRPVEPGGGRRCNPATIADRTAQRSRAGRQNAATLKEGSNTVELHGIPAGGPYRLELGHGGAKASVDRFYVGDVWVLAGRATCRLRQRRHAPASADPPAHDAAQWMQAAEPLHVLGESPDQVHNSGEQLSKAQTASYRKNAQGNRRGLFFAHHLLKCRSAPGPDATAHGSTSEQWTPKQAGREAGLYGSALASIKSPASRSPGCSGTRANRTPARSGCSTPTA